MKKNNTIKERVIRSNRSVRLIAVTVLISSLIAALAGDISAQQQNRARYSEEERKALHKEHTAHIIEKLDLTKEQEEKLLPLLEEGMGLHGPDGFKRSRRSDGRIGMGHFCDSDHPHSFRNSERGDRIRGRAGRMMKRHAEMAGHNRGCRCTRIPDGSYHNGKVNRSNRLPGFNRHSDLSHRRGFHGKSVDKNDRLMNRRHEQMKEIEKILTKDQIEKLHIIHMELRKEMLEKETSDDR